jgi:tRNA(fMet)-specific endonuclease VapC
LVCLDTSFLVGLIRRDGPALATLERIEDEGLRVTTTPISACELFEGAYGSRQSEKAVAKVREILRRTELLNFAVEVCQRYGKLMYDLKSNGRTIGDLDTLIASMALTFNEPVITANVEHFHRVPGLIVESW